MYGVRMLRVGQKLVHGVAGSRDGYSAPRQVASKTFMLPLYMAGMPHLTARNETHLLFIRRKAALRMLSPPAALL